MYSLIILMIIVAAWQIPRFDIKKEKREFYYFLLIWLIAGIYSALLMMNIDYINPIKMIIRVMDLI